MKIFEILPVYVDTIPEELEEGIIYISHKYGIAIHLCACGCKGKTVTGLNPHWNNSGWNLTDNDGKITLRPSIGNFSGENPYHAHYFITNNQIQWL